MPRNKGIREERIPNEAIVEAFRTRRAGSWLVLLPGEQNQVSLLSQCKARYPMVCFSG